MICDESGIYIMPFKWLLIFLSLKKQKNNGASFIKENCAEQLFFCFIFVSFFFSIVPSVEKEEFALHLYLSTH